MSDLEKKEQKPKIEPKKKVEMLFTGEKYCVAAVLTDSVSDGNLYVAAIENGAPGKVHLTEPVYCEADYGRACSLCVTLAKYLDLRAQPPVRDEAGANSAIIRAINPIPLPDGV